MGRAVDIVSILLLLGAGVTFALGVHALGSQRDLQAVYWLVVGALLLRSSVDALRPRAGSR